MSDEYDTSRSVRDVEGVVEYVKHWVLLGGNRLVLAFGLSAVVFVVLAALASSGWLAVGPSSSAASLFASGLTSGTLTLVTIALSVNQLILSRVFGSPGELMTKLEGTRDLRERVEQWTDGPVTTNDPAEFLNVVAITLHDRATRLAEALEDEPGRPGDGGAAAVDGYVDDIAAYGDNLENAIESQTEIVDVLNVIIGTEYARNMTATHAVRAADDDRFTDAAETELTAINDLLEVIAVTRQFFKTLSLQQDFARLSRLIAYTGFGALVVSVALTLIYRSNAVTIPEPTLPIVISLGIALIALPATTFIAYMLRAATIAHRTVSVGPFIPPAER